MNFFFFEGASRVSVATLLVEECGFDLPLPSSAALVERIRLAVLKLADGSAAAVSAHVAAAKQDWRDVLVAAGFGDDLAAHVAWGHALASWRFHVTEVSASVYEVTATDKMGRSVQLKGTDSDLLLTEARNAVLELCRGPTS